jgi:hypothetical protein
MAAEPVNGSLGGGGAPVQRRRRSKWVLVLCVLAGLVAVAGLVLAWLPGLQWRLATAMSDRNQFGAQIYAQALAEGDATEAYRRADARFRAKYDEEQLAASFESHPGLLRPSWTGGTSIRHDSHGGETFRSISYQTGDTRYEIYVVDGDDGLKLLGIVPGLDEGVSKAVREFDLDLDFDF